MTRRRKGIAALVLAATLLVGPAVAAQPSGDPTVDFVVSPSVLELRARPGETVEFPLSVYNRAGHDLVLETYVEDIVIPVHELIGSDELAFTASRWTSFTSGELEVAGGESTDAVIRVEVPQGTPVGGYHAFGFFQSRAEPGVDALQPSGRIGVSVLLEVVQDETELERIARVSSNQINISWRNPFKAVVTATTSVENLGESHVVTGGLHTYRGWPGSSSAESKIGPHATLRGTRHVFESTWESVPLLGKVTVTSELVYQAGPGDLPVIVLQETVWIIPWHFVGLLTVLLAIALLLLRRQRAAGKESEPEEAALSEEQAKPKRTIAKKPVQEAI